eukprot:12260809-Alexandrium_andersonii.AAC.1
MGQQEVARRMATARTRLEFMTKLYQSQLERGARFLQGHPASAASWREPCMTELLSRPEVNSGIGHMRRFGVRVPWPASAGGGGRL